MTQEEKNKLREEQKRKFEEFLSVWEDNILGETPIIDYDPQDLVSPIGKGNKTGDDA